MQVHSEAQTLLPEGGDHESAQSVRGGAGRNEIRNVRGRGGRRGNYRGFQPGARGNGYSNAPRYRGKNLICRNYFGEGTCPFGQRCRFVHAEMERSSRSTRGTWELVRDPAPSKVLPPLHQNFEAEIAKLELLYGPLSVKKEEEKVVLTFRLTPTDPELQPEEVPEGGFELEIAIPYSYEGYIVSKEDMPVLRVLSASAPKFIQDRMALFFNEEILKVAETLRRKTDSQASGDTVPTNDALGTEETPVQTTSRPPVLPQTLKPRGVIYEALKRFSNNLGSLFPRWTTENQKKLESALIYYGRYTNALIKWQKVAEFVGGGHTARTCAERFKAIRSHLQEIKQEESAISNKEADVGTTSDRVDDEGRSDSGTSSVGHGQDTTAAETPPLGEITGGTPIILKGLELKGLQSAMTNVAYLDVACNSCKTQIRLTVRCPSLDLEAGLPASAKAKSGALCPKCKKTEKLACSFPLLHVGNSVGLHVKFEEEQFLVTHAFLEDFLVTCEECSTVMALANVKTGSMRSAECRTCFKPFAFALSSLSTGHEEEGKRVFDRKPKKAKASVVIKVGTPLPETGTCKHYKRSHRWLVFPCCKEAFPCDVCHESKYPEHANTWANRMICGFCSVEQAFSSKECRACGSAQTEVKAKFWEGGKGCRNATAMSKKDPRKYRLLAQAAKKQQNK